MKSFTDEDLKRFERKHEGDYNGRVDCDVCALLARLEAAECVIKESFQPDGMAHIGYDSWHEAYEAWRKAAGK